MATGKFWAVEAGHRPARTAVRVHGGLDMTYRVHRYFMAAKRNVFALGGATTEFRRIGWMYHGTACLPPLSKELVAAFLYSFTRRFTPRIFLETGLKRW